MSFAALLKSLLVCSFFTSLNALAQNGKDCSYGRQIIQEKNETFYVVLKRAPTLYMISRDLYGTERNWQDIARWNNLSSPYALKYGQRLKIKAAPTLSENEAHDVLINTWNKLKSPREVQGISQYASQFPNGCYSPATEEKETAVALATPAPPPVVALAPVAMPATPAPAESEKTDASRLESVLTPASMMQIPSVEKTEAIQEISQARNHSRWKFMAGLTASMFTLKNEMEHTHFENTLHSKLTYSADLKMMYHLSEKVGVFLAGSYQHVDFGKSDSDKIFHDTQNMFKYSLGFEFEATGYLNLTLSYGQVQRFAVKSDVNEAEIDIVTIPEIALGVDLRLWANEAHDFWLVTEVMYAMEKDEKGHKVEAGTDYAAGFNYRHKFQGAAFNISPLYQVVKTDSQISKNEQKSYILKMGFTW